VERQIVVASSRAAGASMSAWYPWIVLLHLACAIVFVGAVAFEVLVVEALH
jgi:hypothetical protein